MLACSILTVTEKGYNSLGCQQKEKRKGKNSNTKGCHSTMAVVQDCLEVYGIAVYHCYKHYGYW